MHCPNDQRAVPAWESCDVSTGLPVFKICHSVEINTIVEAMMPVNLYSDRTVSVQWPHGNGDLDNYGHHKLIRRQM